LPGFAAVRLYPEVETASIKLSIFFQLSLQPGQRGIGQRVALDVGALHPCIPELGIFLGIQVGGYRDTTDRGRQR